LRAYLLYTAVYMAVRGVRAGWNKAARTGRLDAGLITVRQNEQEAVAIGGATE
jgi:biofilm PGA synthesis N-glycosyltransferase PgaC